MELIINANILFSLAKPTTKVREIISLLPISLFAPNFVIEELTKYKQIIMEKSNLQDFNSFIQLLKERINFVELDNYKEEMQKCKNIVPDEKDIEYIALALKLKAPLWSNDKLLKNQPLVKVLTTKEIVEIIEFD